MEIPRRTGAVLDAHTDEVWHLGFSHDGKTLATGSKDCTVILWDVDAALREWSHHGARPEALADGCAQRQQVVAAAAKRAARAIVQGPVEVRVPLQAMPTSAAKVAELSMPKLSVSISRVSVEGLKLVILSADFLLNFEGLLINVGSALSIVIGESAVPQISLSAFESIS